MIAGACAFSIAPSATSTRTFVTESTTAQYLFGGKKDGGEKKGPGMMDQLAMLKKAQEVAAKKMTMDKELAKNDFTGVSADGKIKVTVKYVPPLPMQQPSYEAAAFDIDETYLQSADPSELSTELAVAVKQAYKTATEQVAIKLSELTKELSEIMGDMGNAMPPSATAS